MQEFSTNPDAYFNVNPITGEKTWKSTKQITEEREQAHQQKLDVAHRIAMQQPKETEAAQSLRVISNKADQLRIELKHTADPGQRQKILDHLVLYSASEKRHIDEIHAEQRRIEFANSREVTYARTIADLYEKGTAAAMYPHSDPDLVRQAIATARSDAFETPDALYEAFKTLELQISESDVAGERRAADDARHAALKAGSDAANAEVRAAESRVRLEQAKGGVDGE